MRPAAQWAETVRKGDFAPTEQFFEAVQRDVLEAAARVFEGLHDVDGARVCRELKPGVLGCKPR